MCPVCFKDRLEDGVETIALPLYATKIGDLSPGIPKELFEPPNLSNGFKDSYVYNIIKVSLSLPVVGRLYQAPYYFLPASPPFSIHAYNSCEYRANPLISVPIRKSPSFCSFESF